MKYRVLSNSKIILPLNNQITVKLKDRKQDPSYCYEVLVDIVYTNYIIKG